MPQTPADQLSAVQNPFLLATMRRHNNRQLGAVLRQFLGLLLLDKTDKIGELAPLAEAGDKQADLIIAEARKPAAHLRIGMTVLSDDTKLARAYALFDAKVSDQTVRDLWAHWDVQPPPNFRAEDIHVYRNPRHVLVSQKFLWERNALVATEKSPTA